jgi:carboxymethylenebutenolidase
MGTLLTLTAADGHSLGAYRADPKGTAKAAVVIVQEIFGVNSHIRSVCDGYAENGYVAIAPALFDRLEAGVEMGYEPDDVQAGIKKKMAIADDDAIKDIAAAMAAVSDNGPVSVIGYCWGGSLAYLSACRLQGFTKAVGYYGGQIAQDCANESPKIPTILHFGNQDASIPLDAVEKVKTELPDIPVYVYEAGHGFNCDQRGSYSAEASKVALERTLAFLES